MFSCINAPFKFIRNHYGESENYQEIAFLFNPVELVNPLSRDELFEENVSCLTKGEIAIAKEKR